MIPLEIEGTFNIAHTNGTFSSTSVIINKNKFFKKNICATMKIAALSYTREHGHRGHMAQYVFTETLYFIFSCKNQ